MKTKTTAAKKADKPTKADRIKGRIERLTAVLARYDAKRIKRVERLDALKAKLAGLTKK